MSFEKYEKKGGRFSEPMVSISVAGQISINRATIDKFIGKTKFVNLYFDKDKFAIGIKPTEKYTDNAFKLTSNEIQSNSSISGKSFLKHCGVDFKISKRYVPTWSDKEEMLIIKVG